MVFPQVWNRSWWKFRISLHYSLLRQTLGNEWKCIKFTWRFFPLGFFFCSCFCVMQSKLIKLGLKLERYLMRKRELSCTLYKCRDFRTKKRTIIANVFFSTIKESLRYEPPTHFPCNPLHTGKNRGKIWHNFGVKKCYQI